MRTKLAVAAAIAIACASPARADQSAEALALRAKYQLDVLPGVYRLKGWYGGVRTTRTPSYVGRLVIRRVGYGLSVHWDAWGRHGWGTGLVTVDAQHDGLPVVTLSVGYLRRNGSLGVAVYDVNAAQDPNGRGWDVYLAGETAPAMGHEQAERTPRG